MVAELDLPSRALIGFDGRFAADAPDGHGRRGPHRVCGGRWPRPKQAQKKVASSLRIGRDDRRSATHHAPGEFYERGSRPLEIVATRQWYIRNGGRNEELRARLVARGAELVWHPPYMQHRYDNWVGASRGLAHQPSALLRRADPGVVSHRRRRATRYDDVLVPTEAALPIDPSTDCPTGTPRRTR